MLQQKTTLNCGGQLLDLTDPIVMGIINLTPDSFYDGGKFDTSLAVLKQCETMIQEGATILDIGGASSRPGAATIGPAEELKRVLPAIQKIRKQFPDVILSIDTYWAEVVEQVVDAGIQIVNDISAGSMDENLWSTVARLKIPYVLMHMQGNPKSMQDNPTYENVGTTVFDFFTEKVKALRQLGVADIILDPGFGFGKTVDHNFELMNLISAFTILEEPILIGISRKSMIYKTLGNSAKEALNGTTALNMVALQQGAKILRVHDVKEATETISLWKKLRDNKPSIR